MRGMDDAPAISRLTTLRVSNEAENREPQLHIQKRQSTEAPAKPYSFEDASITLFPL
jgi:hypothetical protein